MSWFILILLFLITSLKNKKPSAEMTVSVVIPAFNESKTVANVVKAALSLDYVTEVIVVDDGSQDNTGELAKNAGAKVFSHMRNLGKGSAIKTGFKVSKGDIIAFIDADLENISPKQVEKIIQPILEGKADITKTKFKRKAGRVTELTAKPLLNFFFPEIKFDQPLSGQFAGKRTSLSKIRFEEDYGVDVGIVLDADVQGLKIKEVDIGSIHHDMSTLTELNAVANEVVRTIVDRALEYGRVTMMDSLGRYIRMGILGISLASLGVFSLFFIRQVPPALGIIIGLIGVVIAAYYIVKLIKRSLNILWRKDGRTQSLKSFTYMHFPILVSSLILLAMLSTLLGAVSVDEGKISIEPASRNLIIWRNTTDNRTFDVRGPYTVDSALENEDTIIRSPKEALDTLGLKNDDKLFINGQGYVLKQPRPGEENILRIPREARLNLNVEIRETIPDGNIRKVFDNLYVQKALTLQGNVSENLTLEEGVIIKTNTQSARTIDIYMDGEKITSTRGTLRNGTYNIFINEVRVRTITWNEDNPQLTYYAYWGSHELRVEILNTVNSDMEFATSSQGRFLNFYFNKN